MIRLLCVIWGLCLCLAPTAPFAETAEHRHGTSSAPAAGTVPLYTGLGNVRHTVTTRSPLAQRFFNQGLALCYAFNHDEAIRAFREAARLLARRGPLECRSRMRGRDRSRSQQSSR